MDKSHEITKSVIHIIDNGFGESPLEKRLRNLNDKKLAEIYVHYFVYSWYYIQENSMMHFFEDSTDIFVSGALLYTEEIGIKIESQKFVSIFEYRFLNFKSDLKKAHESDTLYYPVHFYSCLENPLQVTYNENDDDYRSPIWSKQDLSELFYMQVSFMEDNLCENLDY